MATVRKELEMSEDRLADLERKYGELEDKVAKGDHLLSEYQRQVEQARLTVKDAKDEVLKLSSEVKELSQFTKARNMLMEAFTLLGLNGGQAVDTDSIIEAVIKRIPKGGGGGPVLESREFILKDYQERIVTRLLEKIGKLPPNAKDVLRFMVGINGVTNRFEIAKKLFDESDASFRNKTWSSNWTKEKLTPLIEIEVITYDSKHNRVSYVLRQFLEKELASTAATKDELDNIQGRLEHEVAKGVH